MLAELFRAVLGGGPTRRPTRLFGAGNPLENPALDLNDPKTWDAVTGGIESEAGIKVDHKKTLELGSFWQGVNLISGDLASLQLNVYRRLADDNRQTDNAHSAQFLVSTRANRYTCAYEFWRRFMVHGLLWQNGYAWIEREGRRRDGEPLGLWNLLPDRTAPYWTPEGELYYVTEVDGYLLPFFPEEILHVKGLSIECQAGYDLVQAARNSIGLGLAAQGFASKFFGQGCAAGGTLEIPATFTEKAAANLEEGFRKRTAGPDNWFKTAILRDGAKFHAQTIDPQKSQMHELRVDQDRDAARYLNLPPFKLGLEDSVSYNSAEMAQRIYLSSSLNHWRMAIAGEANIKLLTEEELLGNTRYFEHNVSNFLEIDTLIMNQVLEIQRRNGIINGHEWRRKLNLPKVDDPSLDRYENPNTTSNVVADTISQLAAAAAHRNGTLRNLLPPTHSG